MFSEYSEIEDDIEIKVKYVYNSIKNVKWNLLTDMYFNALNNINIQLQEDLKNEI